jgi:hypothetical protein
MPQIRRSWFAMAVFMFCRQFVDREVAGKLVLGPIVSKSVWVSDPELNSCKEITYMGNRNWWSRESRPRNENIGL